MLTYTAKRVPYEQRPGGLYAAASVVTHSDDNWARGDVEWVEWCDARGHVWPLPCRDAPPSPGEFPEEKVTNESTIAASDPFTIYFRPECTIAGDQEGEVARAGREVHEATEQTVVERHLWRELLGCTPVVASASVACALGTVEQSLAWRYPGQGIIHVPLWAAGHLTNINALVERDGGFWTTVGGTRVVLGAGYFGTPGGGADFGGFFIVGTGAVRVDRGPLFDQDVKDYTQNLSQGLVERNVAVGFGCVCVSAAVTTDCQPPATVMPDYTVN